MSTFFVIIFLPYLVRCEIRKSAKHLQEQSKILSVSSDSPLLSQSSLVLYRIKNLSWILGQKSENVCACTYVCIYIYIYIYIFVCVYIIYT